MFIAIKSEMIFKIQMNEKLSPPEGPMKVNPVSTSVCRLTWNPPKRKSMSKILGYVIERIDVVSGITSTVGFSTTAETFADQLQQDGKYLLCVRAFSSKGEE
jgi:hypothetical protein